MDQTELILPHAASQSGLLGAALSNWKVSHEHSWGTVIPLGNPLDETAWAALTQLQRRY